jgi:hypothetical protein
VCVAQPERVRVVTFVRVIDFETTHEADIEALLDEWQAAHAQHHAIRSRITHDRKNPNHYMTIMEFPSYEAAKVGGDGETRGFVERIEKLCSTKPTYLDLDVVREEEF